MGRAAFLCLLMSACVTPRAVLLGSVSRSTGPVADWPVQLVKPDGSSVETRTDSQGNFRFSPMHGGEYLVKTADAAIKLAPVRAEQKKVSLPSGGIRSAELFLFAESEGSTTSGIVVDQFDRPVGGASVCVICGARGACGDSAQNGTFSTEWIIGSVCEISASRYGRFSHYGRARSASVSLGQTNLRVVIPYLGRVTGTVVDERGRPVEDLRVGEEAFRRGEFDVGIPHDGRLEIAARDFATELIAVGQPDQFGDIVMPRVTLTKGTSIRGTVVDAVTGRPVENATVQVPETLRRRREGWSGCANCDRARNEQLLPVVKSAANGRFDFAHLARSQKELIVTAHGYLDQLISVAEGSAPIVKLERGGIVRGSVLDEAGKGLGELEVYVSAEHRFYTTTRADGSFELSGLPTGSWHLLVNGGREAFRFHATADVKVDQVTSLVLKAASGSTQIEIEGLDAEPDLRLFPGDFDLPASLAEPRELSEWGRSQPGTGNQFWEIPWGAYTLVQVRKRSETSVLVETQRVEVSGEKLRVNWSPTSVREYHAE